MVERRGATKDEDDPTRYQVLKTYHRPRSVLAFLVETSFNPPNDPQGNITTPILQIN